MFNKMRVGNIIKNQLMKFRSTTNLMNIRYLSGGKIEPTKKLISFDQFLEYARNSPEEDLRDVSEAELKKLFDEKAENGTVAISVEGVASYDMNNGEFMGALEPYCPAGTGWEPTYLVNPPKRKRSKYPVPPVADCPGLILPASLNPAYNSNLPYTMDRSEGVTVIKFKEGHPFHEEGEIVMGAMQMTLEWVLPSPPPLHAFEEQPIIKQRPSYEDDGSFEWEEGGH